MIWVNAFSRLHFGLLNPWREEAGEQRHFGGVGIMVERPALRLRIEASESWSSSGTLGWRALTFAQRFAQATRQEEGEKELPPRHLAVEEAALEHIGLGVGTQLGLAVASGLAASWGLTCDLDTLARRVGRGLRSAVGAHGFAQGGLLVEAGKTAPDRLAPLVARLPFPEPWRLVLILPRERADVGVHGGREVEAFAQLAAHPGSPERTDVLCRLTLLGLLPALAEGDVDTFGEALYEFNRRAGEAFAPVQGGVYAGPRVAELVEYVRGQGVRGVGQSSWGPTVFAVVADAGSAQHLAGRLRHHFGLPESSVLVTAACNHGATITSGTSRAPRD
jgi:beta-RFAP synthase